MSSNQPRSFCILLTYFCGCVPTDGTKRSLLLQKFYKEFKDKGMIISKEQLQLTKTVGQGKKKGLLHAKLCASWVHENFMSLLKDFFSQHLSRVRGPVPPNILGGGPITQLL